uniref:Uncharacterized protein n=1 Tax=Eutreptiella gymnastica TaxID=73025 RepID=A0A7S4D0P6_9EUGL
MQEGFTEAAAHTAAPSKGPFPQPVIKTDCSGLHTSNVPFPAVAESKPSCCHRRKMALWGWLKVVIHPATHIQREGTCSRGGEGIQREHDGEGKQFTRLRSVPSGSRAPIAPGSRG